MRVKNKFRYQVIGTKHNKECRFYSDDLDIVECVCYDMIDSGWSVQVAERDYSGNYTIGVDMKV